MTKKDFSEKYGNIKCITKSRIIKFNKSSDIAFISVVLESFLKDYFDGKKIDFKICVLNGSGIHDNAIVDLDLSILYQEYIEKRVQIERITKEIYLCQKKQE